jgi:peptidoglycan biosynthesis protein MviN/MurJ (putative lipid II flippase)
LAQAERWSEFFKLAYRKAAESLAVTLVLLGGVFSVVQVLRIASAHAGLAAAFGQVREKDLGAIGVLLLYMLAILPFTAISQVLSAAYSARQDTGRLARIGAIVYTAAIPMRVVGFAIAGIPGIVAATCAAGSGILEVEQA